MPADAAARPFSSVWSPEARVMLHPWATYRRLAGRPRAPGLRALLSRPALFALLLGACLSLTTSGRLTLRLMLSGALIWSFAPLLQMAGATAVVLLLARRRLPLSRALDLYFLGHGPWSLWLLAVAGALAPLPSARVLALIDGPWVPRALVWLIVLVPFVWSAVITFAFFREALELSPRRALGGLALHGLVIWGAVLSFFLLSDQLWPRVLAVHSP